MLEFLAANSNAIQALGSAVQALFAVVLVAFTWRQLSIAREQTRISDRTRDIAISALGRPYLLVEAAPYHGRAWWHEGNLLSFAFRIRNYGAGPAIISHVRGSTIFSKGRHPVVRRNSRQHLLPEPENLLACYVVPPFVLPDGETPPTTIQRVMAEGRGLKTTTVIPPGNSSPVMLICDEKKAGVDVTDDEGRRRFDFVAPWLLGEIAYQTAYGAIHHTWFCWHGDGDGGVTETYGAPYNHRT